jgi:hypothetical protein
MEHLTMTILTSAARGSISGLARPAVLLLLSLCFPVWAWSAGPSFEIEISDLDKGAPTAKKSPEKPKRSGKKAVPKGRVAPGRPTAKDLEGEFVNYTIRPGDHIYKVLTSRFGLSSERAEALIPRILRVNGVRDTRGLQIGRTIRIPATGKMSAAPAPAGSATPAPAGAAVPVPPATVTPVPMVAGGTGPAVSATSTTKVPIPSAPSAPEAPVQPVPQAALKSPAVPFPQPKAQKVVLRAIPAGEPAAISDALLDALSVKWSKAHPVTIPVGGSGGASLTIPVDRYFEEGGKRFFLDFSEGDADRATLARLLELAGYRRIAVGGKDDFRRIAGKILSALEIASEYRTYSLAPLSGGSGAVEVSGFLIIRTGERLFVTDKPVDKKVSDLIHAGEWDIQ